MTRVFEKRYVNEALFDEALASSREATAIARGARFLRVPEVLAFDRSGLRIEFEYMEGWRTITTLIRSRRFLDTPLRELSDTFRLAGRALAEYHTASSKIHGDFDSTNVLFKLGEPRICIIDFSRPDFDDRPDYYRGTIYRDLALFLIHLRVKYPPHQLHLAYRGENRILSKEFLAGYFEVAAQPYSFDALQAEFTTCMRIPYLARIFMNRALWWTDRFSIEDLR